jgi:hypothetical protein
MKKFMLVFLLVGMSLTLMDNVWGAVFRVDNLFDLQSALTTAGNNGEDDTVEITSGTYNLTSTLTYFAREDHSILIRGAGVATTILDGGNSLQVLNMDTLAADTDANAAITVREITFRNGNKAGSPGGGGLRIETTKAPILVEFCSFEGNHSTSNGGGVVVTPYFATVTLSNNYFHNNSSDQSGGGVYNGPAYSHTPLFLRDNIFSNNSANQSGGGIYYGFSYGLTENNIFVGNWASNGGGWYGFTTFGELILQNNIFTRNAASTDGGAIHIQGDNYFTNNTIYQNIAANRGGGIYIDFFSASTAAAHVYNNIIWGNVANDGNDFRIQGLAAIVNLYNNDFNQFTIQDSSHLFQENNINVNPQFIDVLSDDYHLSSTSPCIDAGTAEAPFLPLTDFDGGTRIYNKKPDIGADEVALTLFSPKRGEQIASGSTFPIEWQSPPNAAKFNLRYSLNKGERWVPIINNITATYYDWPVPIPLGNKTKCLVKVIGYNSSGLKIGTDKSDVPFAIEVVRLTAPSDPGISVTFGDTYDISWATNMTRRPVEKVVLYYTKNAAAVPVTWTKILSFNASDYPGTYPWNVPALPKTKTKCKVRVVLKDAGGETVGVDISDNFFTIQAAP